MLDSNATALAAGLSRFLYLPVAVLGAAVCLYGLVKLAFALRDRDRGAMPPSLLKILVGMVVMLVSLILKHLAVVL